MTPIIVITDTLPSLDSIISTLCVATYYEKRADEASVERRNQLERKEQSGEPIDELERLNADHYEIFIPVINIRQDDKLNEIPDVIEFLRKFNIDYNKIFKM